MAVTSGQPRVLGGAANQTESVLRYMEIILRQLSKLKKDNFEALDLG